MWLAVPQRAPRALQGRGLGRGGSSLVWLARVRVVSEKTRETKETGGDLVGYYYVVVRLATIIKHNTAQHQPWHGQGRPGQSSKQSRHSMTVIWAAVG